ncbi:VTT domain-containing protein [Acidipropionibacterium timonense]|uniref:VTT domain-containing protein n=1 Tax=Acidipropionibacterium timonense TaxID=2161818 RepID=UPI0010303A49
MASDPTTPHDDVATGHVIDAEERPWWDDEGMPWKHKPGRADYWCMGWIAFLGVFSLAMLPLKGWLLGLDAPVMLGLTGSRTGATATGALVSVGQAHGWVWWLLLGSLMSIKLDWVYWWAGKLWGRGMIEVWAGASDRSARTYARAERWADKLGWLGILVAYVPIPLPIMPVVFVLTGASGMRARTFVALDFLAATLWNLGFLALGWAIGAPAVSALRGYAKVANWVAIALVVVVVVLVMRRQNASAKGTPR